MKKETPPIQPKKAVLQIPKIAKIVGSEEAAKLILRAELRTGSEPGLELSVFELHNGEFVMTSRLWPENAKRKVSITYDGETRYL